MGTLAAAGTSNSKTATEPPDASPSSRNRIASCPILISSLLPVTMSTPPLLLALQPLHASGFPRRPLLGKRVNTENRQRLSALLPEQSALLLPVPFLVFAAQIVVVISRVRPKQATFYLFSVASNPLQP